MEYIKKIVKIGGSLGIVLPKSLLEYYDIKENDEIIIEDDEDKIIIRKK